MLGYRALLALALASLLLMVQTGTAVASVIQAGAGSATAPCPGCDEDESPQVPMEGHHAVQCLAHCASEAMAAPASLIVLPPESSERAQARPVLRAPTAASPSLAVPGRPPPKRILYRSFQI